MEVWRWLIYVHVSTKQLSFNENGTSKQEGVLLQYLISQKVQSMQLFL